MYTKLFLLIKDSHLTDGIFNYFPNQLEGIFNSFEDVVIYIKTYCFDEYYSTNEHKRDIFYVEEVALKDGKLEDDSRYGYIAKFENGNFYIDNPSDDEDAERWLLANHYIRN